MDRVTNGRFYQLHTLEFIVIARVEPAVMFEHEAFKLPGGNWYWLARLSFLEWVAFCNDTSFRLEVRLKGDIMHSSFYAL